MVGRTRNVCTMVYQLPLVRRFTDLITALFLVQMPFFFWEVFRRAIRKPVYMNDYYLHFLPVPSGEVLPLSMLILQGLHSMWASRMLYRHGEQPRCSWDIFRNEVDRLKSVYICNSTTPVWFDVFDSPVRERCLACT